MLLAAGARQGNRHRGVPNSLAGQDCHRATREQGGQRQRTRPYHRDHPAALPGHYQRSGGGRVWLAQLCLVRRCSAKLSTKSRGKDDRVSPNATVVVPSYKTGDRSSGVAVLDSTQSSSSGRSATQPTPHNDLKAHTSPRHRSILACLDADPPEDLLPSVLTLALIPLSASSFTIVVMAMPCGSMLSTTSSSSLKNTSVGGSQAVENMSVNEIACGSYLGTRSGRR